MAALVAVLGSSVLGAAVSCPGDCDRNGAVTVDELIVGVGIGLETRPVSDCSSFDVNGDGVVSIDELILAVNVALSDCSAFLPTPTRTATASPTRTPVRPTSTPGPSPTWRVAFDASNLGWMMSGWSAGDGTAWVVGGTLTRGRIMHRSAAGWNEVDPGIAVPLLNWVHGTSGTDVFMGANDGGILHFDGSGWTRQTTPVSAPVWGLWAVAPDDVWAVGGDVAATDPGFVIHYDGSAWSRVELPTLQRPRVYAFFKAWASGAGDLYVVGQNGAVLHYDGHGFTELFLGVSQDLIGVWGTGPNDVMIVGGRGTAEFAHFDGSQWAHVDAPYPGVNGVWMRRSDVAHVVGIGGTILKVDPRTLEAIQEGPVPTGLDLHSVFGDSDGELVALGGNFVTPEKGVALVRRMMDGD